MPQTIEELVAMVEQIKQKKGIDRAFALNAPLLSSLEQEGISKVDEKSATQRVALEVNERVLLHLSRYFL